MRLVIVGGVHGAGKTSVCLRLAPRLGAFHCSAGELLSAIHEEGRDGKAVADVDENQRILVPFVLEMARRHDLLLLDGHFTLLGSDGGIHPIPLAHFRALRPSVLCLVEADAQTIGDRLADRDGTVLDTPILERHIAYEKAHARLVSQDLNVPLCGLASEDDIESLLECIRNGLSRR